MRFPTVLAMLAIAGLALPAVAFKGQLAKRALPIETVREIAEKGDPVTIAGRVVAVDNEKIFKIEDASGSMYVRIPESVRRKWGTPKRNDSLVCQGQYAQAYLDKDIWGVHCQRIELEGQPRFDTGAPASKAP